MLRLYACRYSLLVFFNDTATTEIYTLSLHDALPICDGGRKHYDDDRNSRDRVTEQAQHRLLTTWTTLSSPRNLQSHGRRGDRKSTRLNSSHANISYAVFCLKKKKSLST